MVVDVVSDIWGAMKIAVPRGCLQFVIVVFPDHTHLLFLVNMLKQFRQLFLSFGIIGFIVALSNY